MLRADTCEALILGLSYLRAHTSAHESHDLCAIRNGLSRSLGLTLYQEYQYDVVLALEHSWSPYCNCSFGSRSFKTHAFMLAIASEHALSRREPFFVQAPTV